MAKLQEGAEESNDYKDVSPLVDRRDAPADLCKAARIIDDVVRRLGARMDADLAPRDRNGGWSASYALANHYADGQEAVGAHAGDCLLDMRDILAHSAGNASFTHSSIHSFIHLCYPRHVIP